MTDGRGQDVRDGPLLWGIDRVAEVTGVSPHSIRRWISENRVRSVRLGGRVLVPVAEVERLVTSGLDTDREES